MHYVIMGCGRVGSSLAHSIEARQHTAAVIDVNVDAFRRLGTEFRGITVKGVGFDREVLLAADIEHADGFAAVSSGDNSNILAARVVRESFGVENVVARIYDQARAAVYERLGIPTVATVRWTADQVLRRMVPGGIAGLWRDPSGTVVLCEVPCHPGWIGHRLSEISNHAHTPIPALMRYGNAMLVTESTVLQSGDVVYAMAESERLDAIQASLSVAPIEH